MARLALPSSAVLMIVAVVCTVRAASEPEKAPTAAEAQFFEAKVRPVLVEQCGSCHGNGKEKGGLSLESRKAMMAGGDSGPALDLEKPTESLLIKAINHDGRKMPPKSKLSPEQIADLTAWAKMGAPWPGPDKPVATSTIRRGPFQITDADRKHWAFQPVRAPTIPTVKDKDWGTNPIDAFILAKLEAKGLKPVEPASKQELVRRLYYDLTGLPPTPQEAANFVNDPTPEAYEKLVDRLLASPRYGEKWARHWLDLVRYAESNSYERDDPKPHAWRYRDYVIRSFNDDKPYTRFVREQLAGDELPDATNDSLIATGYYRLGIWDDEPSDREMARYDGLDDLVATTGQVFLGLTFDCARCHDHKIDPIAQKDYYRLVSFFHNVRHYGGVGDEVPLLTSAAAREAYARAVHDLNKKRNDTQAAVTDLENQFRARFAEAGKVRQVDMDELSYRYYRDSWDKLPDFSTLKAESSGKLPRQLFDISPRTRNESFGFVFEGTLIVPADGEYTFFLDSDDGSRLTVDGKMVVEYDGIHGVGDERKAMVKLTQGRLPIKLEYFQKANGFGLEVAWSGPNFGRRSLSTDGNEPVVSLKDLPRAIKLEGVRILGKEGAERYHKLVHELEELKKQKVPAEMALAVAELGSQAPETFVLKRGNPQSRGDKVEPAFPEILGGGQAVVPKPPPGASTSGRRTVLADWIASPDNPMTARVMANRVWQYHFGRGIVRSPNNFGSQGDKPTHPELLDWLATQLVANGWHLKPLHRQILLSNAYRMSSHGNPEGLAADPANDLFWRFDMRRLTAEELRDSLLAVTGTLNDKMYGPSVYPEMPKEVLAGQSVPGRNWFTSAPEDQVRRSVYVHVKRSLLLPILDSFDLAETDRSTPARLITTQPTQALGMLNSTFIRRQSEALAARVQKEAGNQPADQVAYALSLATSRPPTKAEVERGVRLINDLQQKDKASAQHSLEILCLMVLNLNEFVYLD
jgi:mono/diheme cytochrome c family protein